MKNYDQNEQRKIWDSIARGWTGWRHETRDDIKEFTKEWRKGKILDVGCGNGRNLLHFAKLGFDAYGVDFSSEMIKQAENLFKKNEISIKKNHLIVADMTSLPFEDGSFDYCISIASFHHLPKEKQVDGINEIRRVLKKNGECLISVWNKYSFKRIGFWFSAKETFVPWKRREGNETKIYNRYYYLFNYFELKNLLIKNGFKILESSGKFEENITFLIKKI